MFVVKGKSGKVIGRYPTRAAAARRIAQLKAGAQRLAPYKFGSARSPVAGDFDEHAADELRLYLDNDRALYDRKMNSFIPNVRRKIEQGKYDPALAPKLWIYLVDDAAKKYVKEMGGSFDVATRRAVAAQLAKDELQMLMNGEYGPPPALKQKKGRLAHSPYRTGGRRPRPLSRIGQMIEREQDRRHDTYLRTEEGERARMRGNEERLARMRARKSRLAHSPHRSVPNRADLIAALGLEPEGRGRGNKYAATTSEFWHKIRTAHSVAARRARRVFGLPEPR